MGSVVVLEKILLLALLFIDCVSNFDSSRFDRHTVKLIAAKARYGVVGHHVVGFDGDKCKVYPTVEEARTSANLDPNA